MRRTCAALRPASRFGAEGRAARVLVISRRGYAEEASAFSGAKAEDLGNGKYRFQVEVSNVLHFVVMIEAFNDEIGSGMDSG